MTRLLLDVNVLIALIDPGHLFHGAAHRWFAESGQKAWATCPITQCGVVRTLSQPRYPNSPRRPSAVLNLLTDFCAQPGHEFWPDDVQLSTCKYIRPDHLLEVSQITDTYLLALTRIHEGKLATFDRRTVTTAVVGGMDALHVIA